MLNQRYQKTEAGRAEIKARALPLSRSARNLLLMLDSTRSAREWLGMVNGTTEAELAYLLDHGLIASTTVAPVAAPPPAPAAEPSAAPEVQPQGERASYEELYAYLTQNARKMVGMIKGYRMVLEVERCTDLEALREVAWRLVADLDAAKGEDEADRIRLEMRL